MKGWECPKCGRCYSPVTSQCLQCVPALPRAAPQPVLPPMRPVAPNDLWPNPRPPYRYAEVRDPMPGEESTITCHNKP